MSNELSIIIYSCWKNRDMWKIFSTLFHHYWPDCNYQVVLVTDEYHKTDDTYAFTKVVEKDDTWARMIKNAIKEANTPYVMLFMDDYLLCDAVKNEDIEKHLNRAKKYHAGNYRLIESPKCLGIYNGMEEIGYYELGKAYSLTTQPGIWDCKFLCDLMEDHYSAWDFERIASVKSGDFNQPVYNGLIN